MKTKIVAVIVLHFLINANISWAQNKKFLISVTGLQNLDQSLQNQYLKHTESGLLFNSYIIQRQSFGYGISAYYMINNAFYTGLSYQWSKNTYISSFPGGRTMPSLVFYGFSGQFGYTATASKKLRLQFGVGLGLNLNESKVDGLAYIPIYHSDQIEASYLGVELQSKRFSPFINPNMSVVYQFTPSIGFKLSTHYTQEFLANRIMVNYYQSPDEPRSYEIYNESKTRFNFFHIEAGLQLSF